MYANFSQAMRDNFSAERPAQPVLYLDVSLCSYVSLFKFDRKHKKTPLRAITHVEAGSADFAGTTKQSRSTLAPLGLYKGSDKGLPLREHLDLVLPSWNKLIVAGTLRIIDKVIPARPITSADMHGTKTLYGQTSSWHSVWCKSKKGEKQQHACCKHIVEFYDEIIDNIKKVVCELKTFDEMCCYAHYAPSVARGG
eukprot:5006531-Pleurochrysis_carterae.AAC.1